MHHFQYKIIQDIKYKFTNHLKSEAIERNFKYLPPHAI